MPEKNNERIEYLTPEEAKRLTDTLDSWKRQDIARMLKLAMVTGMRRGEVFKLEDRDLKFAERIIVLRDPKGRKDASIPMNNPAKQILEDQIEWRNAWQEKKETETSFIFPGRAGKKRVDCSAVDRIKKKAELPKDFRIFHGLRHHFGVTLANSGEFSLDMIGELLTHRSLTMTKRYAQFLPGTKKAASDRAADLIQSHVASPEAGNMKVVRQK
jgi:integrase